MFELSHLRCFVAVAEELHFGRAAVRLHMTQPPLSRQVQLLEHAVGTLLLERSSRSVRLTQAGKVFLDDARAILRLSEQASMNALLVGQGTQGRVVLGYTAVAGYGLVPRLLRAASKSLPRIDIVLREMVSSDQVQALNDGAIDLAVARPPSTGGDFEWHRVWREPMLLAVPRRHPLAGKPRLRLQDMQDQPLIMYSQQEGRYFHDKIAALFTTTGVRPRFVHHIAQTHTIMALVKSGLGLAIVPASAGELGLGSVLLKPLWRKDICAELFLGWHRENRNPAQEAVRKFCMEHLGNLDVASQGDAGPRALAVRSLDKPRHEQIS